MNRAPLTPQHLIRSVRQVTYAATAFLVAGALSAQAALAGPAAGGTAITLTAAENLAGIIQAIADLFTNGLGIAIGIIAFAAVGVYVMYSRQTGQAVGAVAKVVVGLVIIIGGASLINDITSGVTGAAF